MIEYTNLEEFGDPENYDREEIADNGGEQHPRVAFYTDLAVQHGGPVLDLACGTGIATLPLARRGLPITGLDLSPPMLAYARRKAEAEQLSISWIHDDVRRFRLGQRFGFILMTGNAFQAMLTLADQEALLAHVAEHLAPDGRFAFETRNPGGHDLSTHLDEEFWQRYINTRGLVVHMSTTQRYDAERKILHWTVYRRWKEQGAQQLQVGRIACRFTAPDELNATLARAGFGVEAQYGGWDGQPLVQRSPTIITVVRRG